MAERPARACVRACVRACMCARVRACVRVCVRVRVRVRMRALCVYVCVAHNQGSGLCKILKWLRDRLANLASVWGAKRVCCWIAFFNFKKSNWLQLMPSKNGVLKKRMPIL